MLLPDDIRDLAGRTTIFQKKQVFEDFFLLFMTVRWRWQLRQSNSATAVAVVVAVVVVA